MSTPSALERVQQQQSYLQAMGVQRWLPRQPLDHAPVPAEWVKHFVWPIPDALAVKAIAVKEIAVEKIAVKELADKEMAGYPPKLEGHAADRTSENRLPEKSPSVDKSAHNRAAVVPRRVEGRSQSRQEALASMSMDDPSAKQVKTEQVAVTPEMSSALPDTSAPIPERMRHPQYSLAFVPAGDLLVIDSVPPHGRDVLSAAYKKLVQGICRAVGAEADVESIHQHHWPVFVGSHLDQGGEEAQRAVRRQLDVSLRSYPIQRILLLGEPAAQWLLEQDQSLEAMRGITFTLRSGVKTQVSYSISHMLKLPEFKADCWRDLQPFL